jgi:hypothetical protein
MFDFILKQTKGSMNNNNNNMNMNNNRQNNFQRNNNQSQNYNYNNNNNYNNNYNQGYNNQGNGNYQQYNQRYNQHNMYNNNNSYNNNNNKNSNGYNNNNNYNNGGNKNGNGSYNLPNLMSIKPNGGQHFANDDTNAQTKTQQKHEISELEKYETENQQFNKRHLLAKHQQVQPEKDHISIIEYLVFAVETSLKAVSDKLLMDELEKVNLAMRQAIEVEAQVATIKSEITEETAVGEEVTPSADAPAQVETKPVAHATQVPVIDKEKHRHLKGVFRVGPIEKGIFLKFDRVVQLIGLTSKLPSYNLVRRVVDEFETSTDLFAPEIPPKEEDGAAQDEAAKTTASADAASTEKTANPPRQNTRKRQPPANFDRSKLKLDRNDSVLRENASVSVFYEFSADVVYEFKIAFSSMGISKNTDLIALNAELTGNFYLSII